MNHASATVGEKSTFDAKLPKNKKMHEYLNTCSQFRMRNSHYPIPEAHPYMQFRICTYQNRTG